MYTVLCQSVLAYNCTKGELSVCTLLKVLTFIRELLYVWQLQDLLKGEIRCADYPFNYHVIKVGKVAK